MKDLSKFSTNYYIMCKECGEMVYIYGDAKGKKFCFNCNTKL